ncbi:hypothetical protein GF318_03585 [Candidatus Micrarchaeota archaeon]|nr:hypothetical protein [Candidatus Micrarchaeota archaeon]
MRLLLAIACLSILLLSGALGLVTPQQCDLNPELDRDSERMNCYHNAAITYAYLNNRDRASETCLNIWLIFGAGAPNSNSDIVTKAEMTANNCFYDIALILKDPPVCANIQQRRDNAVNTRLFGEAVSQERCDRETRRLARIDPERYHQPGEDNLCNALFILPLLVLAVFIRGP